jgi:hypothetical protein
MDTVGEFLARFRKLPQTPFSSTTAPKLRLLLRVISGWPTIYPEL